MSFKIRWHLRYLLMLYLPWRTKTFVFCVFTWLLGKCKISMHHIRTIIGRWWARQLFPSLRTARRKTEEKVFVLAWLKLCRLTFLLLWSVISRASNLAAPLKYTTAGILEPSNLISNATMSFFFFSNFRFIYLYYPIRAKRYCTVPVARRVCALIWAVIILYCLPRFFMYRVDENNSLVITPFGKGPFGRVRKLFTRSERNHWGASSLVATTTWWKYHQTGSLITVLFPQQWGMKMPSQFVFCGSSRNEPSFDLFWRRETRSPPPCFTENWMAKMNEMLANHQLPSTHGLPLGHIVILKA